MKSTPGTSRQKTHYCRFNTSNSDNPRRNAVVVPQKKHSASHSRRYLLPIRLLVAWQLSGYPLFGAKIFCPFVCRLLGNLREYSAYVSLRNRHRSPSIKESCSIAVQWIGDHEPNWVLTFRLFLPPCGIEISCAFVFRLVRIRHASFTYISLRNRHRSRSTSKQKILGKCCCGNVFGGSRPSPGRRLCFGF